MGSPGCKGLLTLWGLASLQQLQDEELRREESTFDLLVDRDSAHAQMQGNALRASVATAFAKILEEDGYHYGDRYLKDVYAPNSHPMQSNIAGDDELASGSLRQLRRLIKIKRDNGGIVSEKKFLLSPNLGILCDQAVLRTDKNSIQNSVQGRNYQEHILVDSVKIRLFSPES
jgi:hypothetical protein